MTTVKPALIEQLHEFETPLVAEGMGVLGCKDPENYYVGDDVRLFTQISQPMVGVALTITADTSTPGNQPDADGLWEGFSGIEQSSLPVVVVMKTVGSRPHHECVLGDGMAKVLKSVGSCGLLTSGGVRDIAQINKVGYTVFGSGTVGNHVSLIYRISDQPLELSGVTFSNGDLIHGDADGIVKVPESYHSSIVEACILTRDFETRVHTFWRRSDKTIQEKRDFATRLSKQLHEKVSSTDTLQ